MKNSFYRCCIICATFCSLFTLATPCRAQGVTSDGKDFYLGYFYSSFNKINSGSGRYVEYKTFALIGSYEDNVVEVSYFDPQTGKEESPTRYTVLARQFIQIKLDAIKMKLTHVGDIEKKYASCHITSKKPISVFFFSAGTCAGASYCALPVSGLGKKYVVASWFDNPNGDNAAITPLTKSDTAAGAFIVIGAFDGTAVTITPTTTTSGGFHAGKNSGAGSDGNAHPYTIELQRGECYLVRSAASSNENDISASIITSNKPVSVIAGHENAALGGVGGRPLEGRDYMIEQMVPVEQWDSTGYVTCPLVDPSPIDSASEGVGETFRVYTFDSTLATVSTKITAFSGSRDNSLTQLSPPSTLFDVTAPTHTFSTNGKKIAVMCYDQRNHSTYAPFPAPSMMTIIPISRWKRSYLWYVPATLQTAYHGFYVNIIAKSIDEIVVSSNGKAPVSIAQSGWVKVRQYIGTIPDHSELTCITYKVYPGTYAAYSNSPFIVYQFGNTAQDGDGDLGDFDVDDYFTSYSHPVGMSTQTGLSNTLSIKADTGCAKLHVCVKDTRPGGGIRTVSLIDDTNQYFVKKDFSSKGYRYYNCSIDPKLDPKGMQEIDYTGNDQEVCFDIFLDDISASGYAPLLIVDNSGKTRIIEMTIPKPSFSFSVQDLSFGTLPYGRGKDTTISFTNPAGSSSSYYITGVVLTHSDKSFQVVSTNPTLPVYIAPGKTLLMSLQFTANDTASHLDSLMVISDCLTKKIPMSASVIFPRIVATDIDFDSVVVGKTLCKPLSITNTGTYPFHLRKEFILADTVNFHIDAVNLSILPLDLQPGQTVVLSVCYSPTQIGTAASKIDWATDIDSKIVPYGKSTSILRAKAIAPVSIAMGEHDIEFALIPNPVNTGSLKVILGSENLGNVRIEIYDVLGRKLLEEAFNNRKEFSIDVSDLTAGIYYVHCMIGSKSISRQFEVIK